MIRQSGDNVEGAVFAAETIGSIEVCDGRAVEFSFQKESPLLRGQDLDAGHRIESRHHLMPSDGIGVFGVRGKVKGSGTHADIGLKHGTRITSHDVERHRDEAHRGFGDVGTSVNAHLSLTVHCQSAGAV